MFSDSSADTRCSDDNNIDKTNVDIIYMNILMRQSRLSSLD